MLKSYSPIIKLDLVEFATLLENAIGSFLPKVEKAIYRKGGFTPILKEGEVYYHKEASVNKKNKNLYYFKEKRIFPTVFKEDVYDKDFNLLFTPEDFKSAKVSLTPDMPVSAFELLVEVFNFVILNTNTRRFKTIKQAIEAGIETYYLYNHREVFLSLNKELLDDLSDSILNIIRDVICEIDEVISSSPFYYYCYKRNGYVLIEQSEKLKPKFMKQFEHHLANHYDYDEDAGY